MPLDTLAPRECGAECGEAVMNVLEEPPRLPDVPAKRVRNKKKKGERDLAQGSEWARDIAEHLGCRGE
jgi:hypothetical protein